MMIAIGKTNKAETAVSFPRHYLFPQLQSFSVTTFINLFFVIFLKIHIFVTLFGIENAHLG